MLITILRVLFVSLAVITGWHNGEYFYGGIRDLHPGFGGILGFAVAITLIAAEHAFRRRFTRSLVAFLIGLGGGLVLSYLLIIVLDAAVQNTQLRDHLKVPLALTVTYLTLVIVLRNADRFRLVLPFIEFRSEGIEERGYVVDSSALADGRLLGLVECGLLDQRLTIPRQILAYLESRATRKDDDGGKARAILALDHLDKLRERLGDKLVISDTETATATTTSEAAVQIARLEDLRLISADHQIASRARAEGLAVLDLPTLASYLVPTLRPGQVIDVLIEKSGEEGNQGVGYLDDGSMAVVSGAGAHIGEQVPCTILRQHRTANGRMIFAEYSDRIDSDSQRLPVRRS
ncbi:MAG: TRAM domain-containing protein [Planctomycetota bacterium]